MAGSGVRACIAIARPASLAGSRFIYNVNGAAGLENSPDDLAVQVNQAAEKRSQKGSRVRPESRQGEAGRS
jgi:hypothetical protein